MILKAIRPPKMVMEEVMAVSVLKTQIERIIQPSFRKTKWAKFQRPDGWFICDAWFESGEPRMQIRSSAHDLEEAAIVSTGIQMAIDWLSEEMAAGRNVPTSPTSPQG